jgi:hypothetical protein
LSESEFKDQLEGLTMDIDFNLDDIKTDFIRYDERFQTSPDDPRGEVDFWGIYEDNPYTIPPIPTGTTTGTGTGTTPSQPAGPTVPSGTTTTTATGNTGSGDVVLPNAGTDQDIWDRLLDMIRNQDQTQSGTTSGAGKGDTPTRDESIPDFNPVEDILGSDWEGAPTPETNPADTTTGTGETVLPTTNADGELINPVTNEVIVPKVDPGTGEVIIPKVDVETGEVIYPPAPTGTEGELPTTPTGTEGEIPKTPTEGEVPKTDTEVIPTTPPTPPPPPPPPPPPTTEGEIPKTEGEIPKTETELPEEPTGEPIPEDEWEGMLGAAGAAVPSKAKDKGPIDPFDFGQRFLYPSRDAQPGAAQVGVGNGGRRSNKPLPSAQEQARLRRILQGRK